MLGGVLLRKTRWLKKDTTVPVITNNQTGDDTWRSAAGTVYNVDFTDAGNSGLSFVQYKIYSATGMTGSVLKDWTSIAAGINSNSYTTDWSVDFSALQEGTNYISVKAVDNAGSSVTVSDAFYVKKDVTVPGVTNNQTGDDTWRAAAGAVYNVDFSETGGALLSNVRYKVCAATGQTGTVLKDWTDIATGINASAYTTDWQLDFASLQQGANYVSVSAYDNAGNTVSQNDVFYVKKDSVAPGITNNQTGDDTWRTTAGTVYNTDFSDAVSQLSYVQYTIYSATGQTGTQIKPWTTFSSSINSTDYNPDWIIDFGTCQQGINYV